MKSNLAPDITPETHPEHHTVGHDFMGYSGKNKCSARYYCYSHDASGYNLVNRADPEDDKNISERAIGRTFHLITDYGDGMGEHSQWGWCRIGKDGKPVEKKVATA